MNSAVGPSFKVEFAERGTCGSREQCTGPAQGNLDVDSNANALLSKPTLNDIGDIKDAFAMIVNTTSRPGGYNQYNQFNGRGRGRTGNRGRGNGGGRGSNSSPHQFSPYSSN